MATYNQERLTKLPPVDPDDMPMSISGLAEACKVSRQRIYALVKKGKIAAVPMAGGFVVMPKEARRVMAQRSPIRAKGGTQRVYFDLEKI